MWDLRQQIAFCMDSEGKQHEFSNAQWLSKLVFMVDITEKFNYLNPSLQAESVSQGVGVFWAESKLDSEVGFFYPTTEVQFNHLLYRTPKLRILTRACSNGTTCFETFNETENSPAHHYFH